jgi:hypothetical protein
MRFAYADPPYLGCCKLYSHPHGDGFFGCWDEIHAHKVLVANLCDEFADGWALSCSTPSLRHLLPLCPDNVRVAAWVKPFAIFKPNVNPGYTWEPVLFCGGRRHDRYDPTVRDWVSANVTLKKGLTGAKPEAFCDWILDLLNVLPGDELVDLFPGTGIMGERMLLRAQRDGGAAA